MFHLQLQAAQMCPLVAPGPRPRHQGFDQYMWSVISSLSGWESDLWLGLECLFNEQLLCPCRVSFTNEWVTVYLSPSLCSRLFIISQIHSSSDTAPPFPQGQGSSRDHLVCVWPALHWHLIASVCALTSNYSACHLQPRYTREKGDEWDTRLWAQWDKFPRRVVALLRKEWRDSAATLHWQTAAVHCQCVLLCSDEKQRSEGPELKHRVWLQCPPPVVFFLCCCFTTMD